MVNSSFGHLFKYPTLPYLNVTTLVNITVLRVDYPFESRNKLMLPKCGKSVVGIA